MGLFVYYVNTPRRNNICPSHTRCRDAMYSVAVTRRRTGAAFGCGFLQRAHQDALGFFFCIICT